LLYVDATEKTVLGFLYDPDKTFFHTRVTLKNSPGALGDVLRRLADLKVNVLSSFTSVIPGSQTGLWSAFVESPVGVTAERVTQALKASPDLLDVKITESEDGFLIDRAHFPVSVTPGMRVTLVPSEVLSEMLMKIKTVFGSGGETILYIEGKALGSNGRKIFSNVIGKERQRSLEDKGLPFLQAGGWGRFEVLAHSGDFTSVTVGVTDCFECIGQRAEARFCSFMRGVVAGVFSSLTGRALEAVETSCIATGDSACTFEVMKVLPGTRP
jgi:predicted hydrocarbon binding protein